MKSDYVPKMTDQLPPAPLNKNIFFQMADDIALTMIFSEPIHIRNVSDIRERVFNYLDVFGLREEYLEYRRKGGNNVS